MNCAHKSCSYTVSIASSISCPCCHQIFYCSDQCMSEDWPKHRFQCLATYVDKKKDNVSINSSFNSSISSSSVSRNKRSLDDFEEIENKNKTSLLGKGSYGSVKLMKEKKTGTLYAIKIISKKIIFEYSTVENLKREIKIQKRIDHPHIIKLISYFEDKENVYLVLQYAENGSLFRYLKKKNKFKEEEAFVYFFQTCLGIDYLHKKNIIHRDLKPENLLLDKFGNVKLCDFGWSAESSAQAAKRTTFCGTIDYMAPEMLQNLSHDHRLDIWCLGVLLFELLHGHPPFQGQNESEKCRNILKNGPIEYDDDISDEAFDLISSILKADPNQRLSLMEIFKHPWMKRFESVYSIKIEKYIWKEEKLKPILPKIFDEEKYISPPSEIIPENKKINVNYEQKNKNQTQDSQDDKPKKKSEKNLVSKENETIEKEKIIFEKDRLMREKAKLLKKKENETDLGSENKKINYETQNNKVGFYENPKKTSRYESFHKNTNNIKNYDHRTNRVFSFGENDSFNNGALVESHDKLKQRQFEIECLLQEENEKIGRVSKISRKSLLIDEKYARNSFLGDPPSFLDKFLFACGCFNREKKTE